ncbi:uncharacterized protein LOC123532576 [Mercenaria mercenaria]|uniref:uncharacterized protein LOC123532576 n=1 Tax=Mercenaria mercenaria TaxID=6596 RepID=UPI00234E8517|nr:uncharacterized protein LOC123532576 [Mercenaria mercenaria]
MDERTTVLLQRIINLIKLRHVAKNDLYTSSRATEDAVWTFHQNLAGRLHELADNSVDDLRETCNNQRLVIDSIVEKLTGYVEILTREKQNDDDIQLATQYVEVFERSDALGYNRVSFEANRNLEESLQLMSGIGNCNIGAVSGFAEANSDSTEHSESTRLSDDFKYIHNERNNPMENSWNSLSFGCDPASLNSRNTLSVSDRSICYDSLPRLQSYMTINEVNFEIASTAEDKIKKVEHLLPVENLVKRYVNKFKTCKHRTPCTISDILLTSNMMIVVADHYHNAIQLFAKDFTLLDEKSFPYPIGICELSCTTIAVSLRRSSQLVIFNLEHNSLQEMMVLRVHCEYYLWQVAFKANRLFVVCDENDVHMMGLSGTESCVIHSGVPTERGYLRYFDVDDTGTQIYLCESRGLRCITPTGKLQWRFTNASFPEDQRDKHGHVIEDVCYKNGVILGTHWIQSKIFQISTDGHFLGVVVLDQLEHPRVMSIMGRTLVVAQFHPLMKQSKRRTVKCFELGRDFGTL